MEKERKAIVVGSTGLVGEHLLKLLAEDKMYSEVIAISRKPIGNNVSSVKNEVINFTIENLSRVLHGTDLFFCFGTTLKKAGSKKQFVEIEWGLSQIILEVASQNGIHNLYLVSSLGADAKSKILYSKVKGQIENLVRNLKFKSATIVRPSLLLGNRKENRFGEGLARKIIPYFNCLMKGPLQKYKPISAEQVARRLVYFSHVSVGGVHVIENAQLLEPTHKLGGVNE